MPVNWKIRETYRNQSFKSPAFHGPITPKKPNTITPRKLCPKKPKRNLKEAQKNVKKSSLIRRKY